MRSALPTLARPVSDATVLLDGTPVTGATVLLEVVRDTVSRWRAVNEEAIRQVDSVGNVHTGLTSNIDTRTSQPGGQVEGGDSGSEGSNEGRGGLVVSSFCLCLPL